MSKTKLSDYVLIAEAAGILGVAQNTLRKWADAGKVKTRRNPINGYRLFKVADLDSLLAKIERTKNVDGIQTTPNKSRRKAK